MSISNFIGDCCSKVLDTAEAIGEGSGRLAGRIANGIGDSISGAIDNPLKAGINLAGNIIAGRVIEYAGMKALSLVADTGILGKAGTGRAIKATYGGARTNATLAKIGGGTIKAGGGGIRRGRAIVKATSTATAIGVTSTGKVNSVSIFRRKKDKALLIKSASLIRRELSILKKAVKAAEKPGLIPAGAFSCCSTIAPKIPRLYGKKEINAAKRRITKLESWLETIKQARTITG